MTCDYSVWRVHSRLFHFRVNATLEDGNLLLFPRNPLGDLPTEWAKFLDTVRISNISYLKIAGTPKKSLSCELSEAVLSSPMVREVKMNISSTHNFQYDYILDHRDKQSTIYFLWKNTWSDDCNHHDHNDDCNHSWKGECDLEEYINMDVNAIAPLFRMLQNPSISHFFLSFPQNDEMVRRLMKILVDNSISFPVNDITVFINDSSWDDKYYDDLDKITGKYYLYYRSILYRFQVVSDFYPSFSLLPYEIIELISQYT